MPRFEKGRTKTGGRRKGVPNRPKPIEVVMAKLEQIVSDRAALPDRNCYDRELLERLALAMWRYRNYVLINNDPKYRWGPKNYVDGKLRPKV